MGIVSEASENKLKLAQREEELNNALTWIFDHASSREGYIDAICDIYKDIEDICAELDNLEYEYDREDIKRCMDGESIIDILIEKERKRRK